MEADFRASRRAPICGVETNERAGGEGAPRGRARGGCPLTILFRLWRILNFAPKRPKQLCGTPHTEGGLGGDARNRATPRDARPVCGQMARGGGADLTRGYLAVLSAGIMAAPRVNRHLNSP